jgi:hypothetical protein
MKKLEKKNHILHNNDPNKPFAFGIGVRPVLGIGES